MSLKMVSRMPKAEASKVLRSKVPLYSVSPEVFEIIGETNIPYYRIVKLINVYITKHKLMGKKHLKPDEKISKICGRKSVAYFIFLRFLRKHVTSI